MSMIIISQAILKRFIDFKFSVSGLRWPHKTKPCFVTLTTFLSFLFPLSSFLFPFSPFLFPLSFFPFPFSPFLFPLSSFLFPFSPFLFPVSSFLFPLSSFLFPLSRLISVLSRKDRSDSASRVDCRSFSVLTILTGSRPEKSSKARFKGRATTVPNSIRIELNST